MFLMETETGNLILVSTMPKNYPRNRKLKILSTVNPVENSGQLSKVRAPLNRRLNQEFRFYGGRKLKQENMTLRILFLNHFTAIRLFGQSLSRTD